MKYEELPIEINSPFTGDTMTLKPKDHINDADLVLASSSMDGEMFWFSNTAIYESESGELIFKTI